MAGLLFIWTPWIRYDGSRLMPAFRASRSRFLAEPPLGEPQPRDIDIDPLAHHSGGRLSYLRLLSLIATARWPRASADDPGPCRSQSLLFLANCGPLSGSRH